MTTGPAAGPASASATARTAAPTKLRRAGFIPSDIDLSLMHSSRRLSGAMQAPPLPAQSAFESPQRPEARAKFLRKGLRLLPRREVPGFGEPVVMNELGIRFFLPTPRGLIDLVGKGAHGDGYGNPFRGEKASLLSQLR